MREHKDLWRFLFILDHRVIQYERETLSTSIRTRAIVRAMRRTVFRALHRRVEAIGQTTRHTVLARLSLFVGFLVCISSPLHAVPADPVCDLPESDLADRFLQAAGVTDDDSAPARLARWQKGSLAVTVFQDRSAVAPKDPLQRNLAILRALASLSWTARFSLSFSNPSSDIELIFVDRTTKLRVLQTRPVGTIRSEYTAGCPAYLELDSSGRSVRTISRAHILIDDDVDVDALSACLQTGLINAVGLIGWNSRSVEGLSDEAVVAHFEFFVAVLGNVRDEMNVAHLKQTIAELRSQRCR